VKAKKWLYMPFEIAVREVDAKLLLAVHAVNSGYHVVFGSKAVLRLLHALPRGAILYKSSHPAFADFRRLGHRIVVHDEEGLVLLSEDEAYRRAATESLEHVDLYLCWGQAQKAIVEKAARDSGFGYPVVAVGHPRIDLLHSRFRPIGRQRGGRPRILVNTKLAEYNHARGYDGWLDILVRSRVVRSADELAFRKRQRDYKERLFGHYVSLIRYLAGTFRDCEVMVRPHPAENVSVWKEICSGLENVVVTNAEPVTYWIKQSSVTIHTACTTGIESALLGCPAISFHPENGQEFHSELPELVSIAASSREEVAAVVASYVANDRRESERENSVPPHAVEMLSRHIANMGTGDSYASILDEIDRLDLPSTSLGLAQRLNLFARRAKRFLYGLRGGSAPSALSVAEVTAKIRDIERCYSGSSQVVVQALDTNVFALSQEGP
jgi:surface carbohydrate biosynthesis protein